MTIDLLLFLISKPWKFREILILRKFRKTRERNCEKEQENLEEAQYFWVTEKYKYNYELVKKTIRIWIHKKPLKYLRFCVYKSMKKLIDDLEKAEKKYTFLSDYPVDSKLRAMGISFEKSFSSTDSEINSFKPHPNGLLYIMKKYNHI